MFDWQSIATAARPGRDTESQRRQAARAQAIEPLLRAATAPFVATNPAFERYVSQSVFFATACAPQMLVDEDAALLAYLIWWIFITDTYIDQQDEPFRDDIRQVESALLSCLPTLVRHHGKSDLRRAGWSTVPSSTLLTNTPVFSPEGTDEPHEGQIFSVALAQWLERITQHGIDLRHIARQIACCIGSMRQELVWSGALSNQSRRSSLPTLEQYLLVAARTTGLHPTAAFVAALASVSGQTYRRAWFMVERAAPIIRLANDLASDDADGLENHLTALQAAHFEQKGALAQAHRLTAEEVRQARVVVASALQRRVHALAVWLESTAGSGEASTDVLSQFVTRTLATSLAVYGDGSAWLAPEPMPLIEPSPPTIGIEVDTEFAPYLGPSLGHGDGYADQPIAH